MLRPRALAALATITVAGTLTVLVPTAPADAAPPTQPPPRYGAAMAYDGRHGQVVLFGGYDVDGTFYGDTWTWDGTGWTRRAPAHSPSRRWGMSMAYDATQGQIVLFGGKANFGGGRYGELGDTWIWDDTDWTLRTPAHTPSPREAMAMADDAADGQVVLFGGVDNHFRNDTWTWNGTDWTLHNPAHAPSPRWLPGMAENPTDHHVLLFGGQDGYEYLLGDTWTWNGVDWSERNPTHAPSERWPSDGMAYDAADNEDVLFGGYGFGGGLGDTWTWSGEDWTARSPTHAPSRRCHMGSTFDAAEGEVVLFGGGDCDNGAGLGDTWTWDGADWSIPFKASMTLTPSSGPPGTVIDVTGSGFGATEPVKITFLDSTIGNSTLAKVTTDRTGAFTAQITIPIGATLGRQFIRAKNQALKHGFGSGQRVKRAFTVT